MYIKEHSLGIEKVIEICDTVSSIDVHGMPEIIYRSAMSLDRRNYLYEKIRPFCSSVEAAELTCPPVVKEQEEMCIQPEATEKSSLNENVVTAVSLGTQKPWCYSPPSVARKNK